MNRVLSRRLLYVPLMALAACLFTTRAKADAYKGEFTLTSPVQWGNLVLQPGTYQFSLPSASYPCTLYIQGNGQRAVLNSAVCGQAPNSKPGSATANLKIVGVNGQMVVRELDLPSVGIELDYAIPKQIQMVNGEHSPEAKASGSGKQ